MDPIAKVGDRVDPWERVALRMKGKTREELVRRIDEAWETFDVHGHGYLPYKSVMKIVRTLTKEPATLAEGPGYFLDAVMNPREGTMVRQDAFRAAFLNRVKPVRGNMINRLLARPRLEHTRETSYLLPPVDTRHGRPSGISTESAGLATSQWGGVQYDNLHPEDPRSPRVPLRVGKRRQDVRSLIHGHPPIKRGNNMTNIIGNKWGGTDGPMEPTYPRGSELELRSTRVALATREGRMHKTGYLATRDTSTGGGVDPATVTKIGGRMAPPNIRHTITSRGIARVGREKADQMEVGEYIPWFRPQTAGWKIRRFGNTTKAKIDTFIDREPAAYKELISRRKKLQATMAANKAHRILSRPSTAY